MIEQWTVSNFKSAQGRTSLPLRHVTVFAGPNSAGKSTILQSMLLIAQTVTNRVGSRPIVLNGHVQRLGTFADVCSTGARKRQVTLGFRYRSTIESKFGPDTPEVAHHHHSLDQYSQFGCEISFSPSSYEDTIELGELQPALDSCAVFASGARGEIDDAIRFKRAELDPTSRAVELGIDPANLEPPALAALRYEVTNQKQVAKLLSPYRGQQADADSIVGVRLQHFLPDAVSVLIDRTQILSADVARHLLSIDQHRARRVSLTEEHAPYFTPEAIRAAWHAAAEVAQKEIESLERAHSIPPGQKSRLTTLKALQAQAESHPTVDSIVELTSTLCRRPSNRSMIADMADSVAEAAIGTHPPQPAIGFRFLQDEIGYAIHELFAFYFKYLGPLRDPPKPVYPLEGSVDPSDVGYRGEYTAAVLDIHQATEVLYVSPLGIGEDGVPTTLKRAPLRQAVIEWLQYLGVVDALQTKDRGVFGHELQVSSSGAGVFHNLVHVGVGVSQVLPILVMSLLSSPGSVIVLEQPELHLHPAVQSRLGDFLLTLAATDKQCIVETHSEYLINRLRLRAAQDPKNTTQDSLLVYYVENQGARSQYRTVDINEFGAIGDWPEGFFDQSPNEAEQILRAAMRKRASPPRDQEQS